LWKFYFPLLGMQHFFFSLPRVTFGSRRTKCEDYWLWHLSCGCDSELVIHTREIQQVLITTTFT
jgi:hypothetical protein